MKISVLTLVRNRQGALQNTLRGLAAGTVLPDEVIVVHMNEEPGEYAGKYPFPVHALHFKSTAPTHLSAARNYGAAQARFPLLVFLDVDCIPDRTLIQTYREVLAASDVLWSGKIRYLREGFDREPQWRGQLYALSDADPVRSGLSDLPYELFWSLNFGCSAEVFRRIGGFDEAYRGYGGEDTDFAFAAKAAEIPHRLVDALSYHQHHPSYNPPLNHLEAIVPAARYFFSKWGQWPMDGWLKKFRDLGFLRWEGEEMSILRLPDPDELAAFRK